MYVSIDKFSQVRYNVHILIIKEFYIMSITNATNFRKDFFKYLDTAINDNQVITVTTKSGNAIILNEEEYNALIETAYLNSIPNMAQSIIDGSNTPTDELVEIDWKNELQD